jgi:protein-L-isoaspartate(D-aspartate) O-methyltransferase
MNTTILSSNPIRKRFFSFALLFCSSLLLPVFREAYSFAAKHEEDLFARSRREMVEKNLRGRGIKDSRVLDAMGRLPRHLFVEERQRSMAYQDGPLPIGEGQTISQPYIVALMTELLELKGNERVLEIGTGSGYQAAVLSEITREVYTIEIVPSLAARASAILAKLGYKNVSVKAGDGFFGWKEKAPFDAILLTAAPEELPEPLWLQLQEGGRLVMPVGGQGRDQRLVRLRKVNGERRTEQITTVIFVPMTGEAQEERR